ncbi:hypothetical protein AKJ09_02024 [Labilithrix luteola]|uniref:Uncharacterized protein n=1 Tax=Labilithrix luteola TaxID=1391654 RepID=A0A0K1PP91_9BACT|nr:hypothetical protein [Labilithrix luteola]AKU95360.1 hypothetical protein AKJ09_02024 [Labilithrix luteola]
MVSFGALAARLASDLGASVVRPGGPSPSRAALRIRYRGGELTVTATHADGRSLERTVKARGDDAAVQHEAILLAANLARDEAGEIVGALATPPAPPPASAAQAAEPPEGEVPLSVAFLYPLATNFEHPNVTSKFDFSLLYGRVGKIDGLQFGSGIVAASRGVSGLQFAGFGAASGGTIDGAQIAGFGTLSQGRVTGVAVGGYANLSLDGVKGVQVAGAFNLAQTSMTGAQVGGAVNLATGGAKGLQLAGAFNYAKGSATGIQLAGALNLASGDMSGVQIAGAVNVAENVDGMQLGVVNVARRVRGTQIGVVNIADEFDGVPIGVINITRNGIHPMVWFSNLEYTNVGVKFSTKYVYTIIGGYYGSQETGFRNFGTTAVLGGHIPLVAGLDLEIQGALTNLHPRPSEHSNSKDGNLWIAPQAMVGYSFAPHLRVFAGGGARFPLIVDIGNDVVRPEVLGGIQF